jgi:hypothetical protein
MRSSVSIRGRTESAPRCIIGTKAEAVEARQARRSPAACMLEDDEQKTMKCDFVNDWLAIGAQAALARTANRPRL